MTYPIFCTCYLENIDPEYLVYLDADDLYGDESISLSLKNVHDLIRDKALVHFDWFAAIDDVPFPSSPADDVMVPVGADDGNDIVIYGGGAKLDRVVI